MEGIGKERLVVAIIDDYTTIHSRHRPDGAKASAACVMCTMVCRIFPGIPAIPLSTIERLHCPFGIDVTSMTQEMPSLQTMNTFANVYTNTMPGWIRWTTFDPEQVRNHQDVHAYHHLIIRKM